MSNDKLRLKDVEPYYPQRPEGNPATLNSGLLTANDKGQAAPVVDSPYREASLPQAPTPAPARQSTTQNPATDRTNKIMHGFSGSDTVQGQMAGLLNQNSLYMQNAKKTGERMAHSRGLLNSGLSGQYAQKAAIESSLPIAQQDASQYFQSKMFDKDAAQQEKMLKMKYENELDLQSKLADQKYENEYDLQSKLADQKFQHETQLMEMEFENGLTMQEMLNQHQKAMQEMAQSHDVTMEELSSQNALFHDKTIQEIQNNHEMARDERLAAYKLTHDTAIQEIANRHDLTVIEKQAQENLAFETAIQGILHDNNMEMVDKQAAIQLLHDERMARINRDMQIDVDAARAERQNAHDIVMQGILTNDKLTLMEKQGAIDKAVQTTILGIQNHHAMTMQERAGEIDLFTQSEIQKLRNSGVMDQITLQASINRIENEKDRALQTMLTEFEAENKTMLTAMNIDMEHALATKQYDFARWETEMQQAHDIGKYQFAAQHDKEMARINNDTTMTQMEKQAAIQMQQLEYETAQRYELEAMNNASREKLVGWELTSGETKAAASSITLLGDNLLSKIVAIDTDPNMTPEAKEAAIANAQDSYYAMVDNIGLMYGAEVTWE